MLICAALLVQVEGLDHTTIIPCRRHGDGFKIIKDLVQSRTAFKEIAQGFIDDKGNFLDRKEALAHALKCGQLSATHRYYQEDHNINELYSEDLY
jgi:hypothetical protein